MSICEMTKNTRKSTNDLPVPPVPDHLRWEALVGRREDSTGDTARPRDQHPGRQYPHPEKDVKEFLIISCMFSNGF